MIFIFKDFNITSHDSSGGEKKKKERKNFHHNVTTRINSRHKVSTNYNE